MIADLAERRKAERLLAIAKATFTWSPAPTAEAIAEASRRRLEEDLLAATLPENAEEARGLARRLLKVHKKEDLLELLLVRELGRCPVGVPLKTVDPKYLARASRNEPLDLPPRRKRADFERDAVVFRVNLGAEQKAEPGWLLPLICRRGGVTRNEVGAIRVGSTWSEFQIAGDAARDFALAASRPDPRAPHVVIESSQARGPRPQYGPPQRSDRTRSPASLARAGQAEVEAPPQASTGIANPARCPDRGMLPTSMAQDDRSNADLPWLRVEGNRITDPGGRAVVLRGVSLVDLGATEAWYGGVRAMVDRLTDRNDTEGGVAGWYPTVLRLPIYPADSTDFASPNTYREGSDAFYDELLRPTIDYCAQKGLYVIVDWHYIGNTHEHRQTTEAFWRYMSAKLAGDSHVLFELFNEPVNGGDWDSVRPEMQAWYDIVRLRAPRNLVLVGTPNWCSLAGATADRPLDGANLAYVSHMYPLHWNQPELRERITLAATRHAVFHTEWGFQAGVPGENGAVVSGTVSSFGAPFEISWNGRGSAGRPGVPATTGARRSSTPTGPCAPAKAGWAPSSSAGCTKSRDAMPPPRSR